MNMPSQTPASPRVELQHKDIAQNNAEQPHAYDADRHGEFGIAAGAQGVGQRKAAVAQKKTLDNVEPVRTTMGAEGGGLRREVEPDHEQGNQEEQRGIGRRPDPTMAMPISRNDIPLAPAFSRLRPDIGRQRGSWQGSSCCRGCLPVLKACWQRRWPRWPRCPAWRSGC